METTFLAVILSMLFVAGLPLIAKFVGNLLDFLEDDTHKDRIHKTAAQ
jgi:hypothetical protein